MKLAGRRKSKNTVEPKTARAKYIQTKASVSTFVRKRLAGYGDLLEDPFPSEKQKILNKRMGSGMPNSKSLKMDKPKPKKKGR